jgi:hypothetical protein
MRNALCEQRVGDHTVTRTVDQRRSVAEPGDVDALTGGRLVAGARNGDVGCQRRRPWSAMILRYRSTSIERT